MQWFAAQGVRPRIVGEFDDRALMQDFGEAGNGVFAAPAPLREQLKQRYGVVTLGEADQVAEEFYAISVERRLTAPAVLAMREAARQSLFRQPTGAVPLRRSGPRQRSKRSPRN
jgi:LysR family transcriptional activator of nhaA